MSDERPRVTIYTDGGADPNPGPGGWAAILIHESTGHEREMYGHEADTTNNRMELTAALRALSALKTPCTVEFYTDSEYLRRGITEWLDGWRRDGWKRKKGELQNADLWRGLSTVIEHHVIGWHWVKGHAGNKYNERADQLATQAIKAFYAEHPERAPSSQYRAYLLVSANKGNGWWGAFIRTNDEERLIFAHETEVTSNRLDVIGAINILYEIPEQATVNIYTRSDYLRNGASAWIKGWKARQWMTKSGEPVKNQDVWEELDFLMQDRRVNWPAVDEDMDFEFEDLGNRLREEIEEAQRADHDSFDDV